MLSSTTFMLSFHRAECVRSTTCSPTTWPHMPTFASTKAKLEYGIVAAKSQQTFTPWDLQHGSATRHSPQASKDSPCWGHPLAQRRTSKSSSRTPSTSTSLCWTNCPASLISKQHGCFCSTQPAPAATTYSGFFHPQQQALSPKITTLQLHVASASSCTAMISVDALSRAHLPLAMGGLGLMSASHLAIPAYWASWADAIPVLHRQAPVVAANIQHQFADPSRAPPQVQAARAARRALQYHGWEPPLATVSRRTPPAQPSNSRGRPHPARLATARHTRIHHCSACTRIQHPRPSQSSHA